MDVFNLYLDHGVSPDSGSYQYIVVPDISAQALRQSSGDNRGIEILSNTADLQAVKHNKLGICQLAFYKAGTITVSEGMTLNMARQGMLMLKMQGNSLHEISVADPSRKLEKVMVTIAGHYDLKGDHFVAIPNKAQNQTLFIVDLPQGVYAGKSQTISFK